MAPQPSHGIARPAPAGAAVADAMIHSPKVCRAHTTVAQVRDLLRDDHVHAALIVHHGRLLAVVERSDLVNSMPTDGWARAAGGLEGRVTRPDAELAATWQAMKAAGRRRLAVIDSDRRLLGLLCLKRSGLGFCSDSDVRARTEDSIICDADDRCGSGR
ncbi:MAG: CBS domain-containing protein [Sciscionella sp.]